MPKLFSSTAKKVITWMGYNKKSLPTQFKKAAETYSENGAVKKVGPIKSIEILHRNDGSSPVHQSSYNPKDKALIISARITPVSGGPARTHHIYSDGTGTFAKGDKREHSTSARA